MLDRQKVVEALRRVQARDERLGQELEQALERRRQDTSNEVIFTRHHESDAALGLTPEAIVLRTGRPVLAIRQNRVEVRIDDADSEVWRKRLADASPRLEIPIRGVGRIEVQGHPSFSWLGTGWLVRPDILVTNRHVAAEFTRRKGSGFQFRSGPGQGPMSARVDFLEELGSVANREFSLSQVLHVEDEDGPDLAFFRVAGSGLTQPIALSEQGARENDLVAVIGYPARDSRIPDQDLMTRLFGEVYEKKRLAPGQITGVRKGVLLHDCSTLGGNSGSAVVSLKSGAAVALHFAGRFLEANYAVASDTVAERLHAIEHGGPRRKLSDGSGAQPMAGGEAALSFTIPLQVTIRVDPVIGVLSASAAVPGPAPADTMPSAPRHDDAGSAEHDIAVEGRPEDYLDRRGYLPGFLGSGMLVELPEITRGSDRILRFSFDDNQRESVLRYQNFSVVMNRERRMCFFSAVNISGGQSRKTRRTGWTLDPRIPAHFQIKGECYGPPPKFSRGHMTRREDPAWGDPGEAHRGNADSMHVTNAVPQMQTFNGGIWLDLEDYALDHARDDDMKICVLTGPVFDPGDPVRYGVQVPVQFWKVIAFIHDKTHALSATGYSISQERFLTNDEHVFGAHETHQRSLAWIEEAAGMSFGDLTAHDRFGERESPSAGPLRNAGHIRWV